MYGLARVKVDLWLRPPRGTDGRNNYQRGDEAVSNQSSRFAETHHDGEVASAQAPGRLWPLANQSGESGAVAFPPCPKTVCSGVCCRGATQGIKSQSPQRILWALANSSACFERGGLEVKQWQSTTFVLEVNPRNSTPTG